MWYFLVPRLYFLIRGIIRYVWSPTRGFRVSCDLELYYLKEMYIFSNILDKYEGLVPTRLYFDVLFSPSMTLT